VKLVRRARARNKSQKPTTKRANKGNARPRIKAKAKPKGKATAKAKLKARPSAKRAAARKLAAPRVPSKTIRSRRPAKSARAAALEASCASAGRHDDALVEAALAESSGLLESVGATRGGSAAASGSVGVVKVPADRFGDGYEFFRVRADLAASYNALRERVLAAGGVITSSGGRRAVTEPATPGRSKTSLHYTGRAIDLAVSSGMQPGKTPYIVVRDGGTDERPLWKLYCEVNSDDVPAETREWPALVWKKGKGAVVVPRQARAICLTDLFEAEGWRRIPARAGWQTTYMCCEWWHFQNESGLVSGQSRFGDELRKAWPAQAVAASGLALDAVWARQSFVAPNS